MLPDHVNPVGFFIVVGFAIVFTGVGLWVILRTLRVRQQGIRTRFRIVDFEIHADSEGEAYPPVYEILDGPRCGEIVRSDTMSTASSMTVLNTNVESKRIRKLRNKIGTESKGWVHASDATGMTMKDMLGGVLFGAAFLIVGIGATALAMSAFTG